MVSDRGILLVTAVLACLPGSCTEDPTGPLSTGMWGGVGISFDVSADSTVAEFDCASGVVRGPIRLDGGRFRQPVDYIVGQGGPIREGEPPDLRAAVYDGRVSGRRLDLIIEVEGFAQALGPFRLERGSAAVLRRCL